MARIYVGLSSQLVLLGALLLLWLTRLPLSPNRLFYFDSVNFAFALRDFNPALHQPQPPGYPLFVLLARVFNMVIASPQTVFVTVGIVGAMAAVFCLWRLAGEMAGDTTAMLATALLTFSPILWFGGLTNQVRIFLAVASTVTAYLNWRAARTDVPVQRLYVAALALGAVTGFRPISLLPLTPLLAYAIWKRRPSLPQTFLTLACLALPISLWGSVIVIASGGIFQTLHMVIAYAQDQFHGTSLFFGAGPSAAWHMFLAAVTWNSIAFLTVSWAFLFPSRPEGRWRLLRTERAFLAVWFLPGFLFQAMVHVADPDQTLLTVPAGCLIAAILLAGTRIPVPAALAATVLLNAFIFWSPLPQWRATSLRAVRSSAKRIDSTLSSLESLRRQGPLHIIWCGSLTTWRHLSYYLPDQTIWVVEDGQVWQLKSNHREELASGPIRMPQGNVALLAPWGSSLRAQLEQELKPQKHGSVIYVESKPGMDFQLFGRHFVTVPPTPASL